ncbi:MAG: hypothetical protein HC921_20970 [Synechococcaceae cyanobacterium SM2_3_1]|nr:hypothetical protein [Synechococcaceae cyanobacterium SM2_3_1]
MNPEQEIKQANERLKLSGCRLRIEQRRNSLVLRGILPPKPGSPHTKPHQQRIPLGGIRLSVAGIKRATALAQKIDAEVTLGSFDWKSYVGEVEAGEKIGPLLKRFENHYFSSRERNEQTQTTWDSCYWEVYKRLDPAGKLTEHTAKECLFRTKPDSRNRVRYYTALTKLMKYAKTPYDIDSWKELRGNYGKSDPAPRDLLSDEEIIKIWGDIDDVFTAYCWGFLATYGLRTHELWHLNTNPLLEGENYVLVGKQTKSKKPRKAYPLPQEWIELFELRIEWGLKAPAGLQNRLLGARISKRFAWRDLPTPYTLRHCYRVRGLRARLDPVVSSRSMGHSVEVGQGHYTRWVQDQDIARAFQQINRELATSPDPVLQGQ